MNKVLKYATAYAMWIVDMVLSVWLIFICRTAVIGILAVFNTGDYQYAKVVNLVDRVLIFGLGLGWLVLAVFTEDYYRSGALKANLAKRFAKVTGPILLALFIIDLVLFWVQGINNSAWERWLILAVELVLGLVLWRFGRMKFENKPN